MPPGRLFVYLACEAPLAVVLRRGPTDWARLSLWHTDTDRFEHGQWIKGRVYERRSDLSPDGRLFAAFVRQSGGRVTGGADTWVAVSRPPYFSALAVWFVGGTYHTGAFFPGPRALWLGFQPETPPDVGSVAPWLRIVPPPDIAYVDGTNEWTDRTVHFNRLLRDGWELLEKNAFRTLWRRPHPALPMTLHMMQSFEGYQGPHGGYLVEYSVSREDGAPETVIGAADWADWDQRGRLVVAREGRVLHWPIEQGTPQVLADFSDQQPDPQPAPEFARIWPSDAV